MSKILQFRRSASATNVDVTSRTITGVIVMSRGQVKDYRQYVLDDAFADALMKSAARDKKGVMANYGHNYDNLGKRLGRFTNFADDGTDIRADITIFQSADDSPSLKGLGTYVLKMAQEDNQALMSSIKFSYKYEFQRDGSGKEYKVNYYDREKSQWVPSNPDMGDVYLKFDQLRSVDIVDEGAATDKLFTSQDELAQAAHDLLHTPGIEDILASHRFPVLEQLYGAHHEPESILDRLKALLGLSKDVSHPITPQNQEDVDQETFNKLQADVTAKDAEIAALKAEKEKLAKDAASVTELTSALTALTNRIDALEKTPQAKHSQGNEEDEPAQEKVAAYKLNPLNAKWLERQKANATK